MSQKRGPVHIRTTLSRLCLELRAGRYNARMLDNPLLTIILSLISAGGGAYLGSYLKKKGENLATHEDIDKLVDQVAAVTVATKTIESKISNDVWERQRKWDLKREALFELMKAITTLANALGKFDATFRALRDIAPHEPQNADLWAKRRSEAIASYNSANTEFENATMLAYLTCGSEISKVIDTMKLMNDESLRQLLKGDFTSYDKNLPKSFVALNELKREIRKELRIDDEIGLLPGASAAVEGPVG